MKIGVLSDTHGNSRALQLALQTLGKVDYILHAGDHCQDIAVLSNSAAVIAVRGNCDGSSAAPVDEFIELGGKKIWLTHGHKYHVKQGIEELQWWAKHYGVDAVVYGHTHIADVTWFEDTLIFNPGSVAYPPSGHKASCGMLEIDNGKLSAKIITIA